MHLKTTAKRWLLPALALAFFVPGPTPADTDSGLLAAPMDTAGPSEPAPSAGLVFPPPADTSPTLKLPPVKAPVFGRRASVQSARRTARKPTPTKRPTPPLSRVSERAFQYGLSVQGAPLRAWVLDNGAGAASDVTLIFGGFHGDERGTPGVVMDLRAFLRAHPETWPDRRAVLVPIANPDGWAARTRPNARGVDLNRNFPADWAPAARAARYSPGPAAASEPETRAMMALLAHVRPAKVVSLHSPLRCLNPTGPLGRRMAEAMHAQDGLPIRPDIGYPTPGSLGDFCGRHGIGIVTLELPAGRPLAAWRANGPALLAAIRLTP